jgi:hypothetical protein
MFPPKRPPMGPPNQSMAPKKPQMGPPPNLGGGIGPSPSMMPPPPPSGGMPPMMPPRMGPPPMMGGSMGAAPPVPSPTMPPPSMSGMTPPNPTMSGPMGPQGPQGIGPNPAMMDSLIQRRRLMQGNTGGQDPQMTTMTPQPGFDGRPNGQF